MRIIKEVNHEYIHKCRHCKSIYTYTAGDVKHCWNDFIVCPVCQRQDEPSFFDKKVKQC